MNWKLSEVSWSLPKVGKVCKVAGLFYISLVDIGFEKISSKKEITCVLPCQPSPLVFKYQVCIPPIQHIGMYVPSRAALIEILKKDGTLSLSLSLSIQIRLVP